MYQFHGVRMTEPTAAIMPPIRQLIFCGLTLEKSNAGEMKLATMLMPMVAMTKVRPPSRMANGGVDPAHGLDRVGDQLAEHRHGGRGGDDGQEREEQEVDRQAQKLPFLTALKLLP